MSNFQVVTKSKNDLLGRPMKTVFMQVKSGTLTNAGELCSVPSFTLAANLAEAAYKCNHKNFTIRHTRITVFAYNTSAGQTASVRAQVFRLRYDPTLGYIDTANFFSNFQRYVLSGTASMFLANLKSENENNVNIVPISEKIDTLGTQGSMSSDRMFIFDIANQFDLTIEDSKFTSGGTVNISQDVIGDFPFLLLSGFQRSNAPPTVHVNYQFWFSEDIYSEKLY